MKYNRLFTHLLGNIIVTLFCVSMAFADTSRTQVVHLKKGWNAVFMEVNPLISNPTDLFQGSPVTMAAAFTGADKTVEFVQNPSTNLLNKINGWDVWYAPSRADAFLTDVFQLVGNKPYLLYSESDFNLSINGDTLLNVVKWRPNSFSLVGFGVDDVSPPTFEQYFSGSAAHRPYNIYRLVNDVWTKVDNAQATQMRSGEAYWIYCQGGSDYQGPVTVRPEVGNAISLQGGEFAGVLLQNKTSNPLNIRIHNTAGGIQLPLSYALRAATETNVISANFDLPDNFLLPEFDSGEKRGFWLTLRPERMSVATQTGSLKITTDLGTQCWLPITGKRSSITPSN